MLMIEQPEIHLHPKMQAELGDLIIDMSGIKAQTNPNGARLLLKLIANIFINRLRNRISNGAISHADLAIYYVEPKLGRGEELESREMRSLLMEISNGRKSFI